MAKITQWPSQTDMDTLAAMVEFKTTFSGFEPKLEAIHSKSSHERWLVESNTNAVSNGIRALEMSCAALANDNAKLKANVLDPHLDKQFSRSLHQWNQSLFFR